MHQLNHKISKWSTWWVHWTTKSPYIHSKRWDWLISKVF